VVFLLHDSSVNFSFKTGSINVDDAVRATDGVVAPDAADTMLKVKSDAHSRGPVVKATYRIGRCTS